MRIAIVAFSPVARDSRVLRTSRALAEHGHEVHLIGYGACPDIGSGRFHSLGPPPTRVAHWTWVIAGYAPTILSPRLSRFTAPLHPLHRRCCALLRQIRPDVIHANDWPVLPVAMMMKKETGARIVYGFTGAVMGPLDARRKVAVAGRATAKRKPAAKAKAAPKAKRGAR